MPIYIRPVSNIIFVVGGFPPGGGPGDGAVGWIIYSTAGGPGRNIRFIDETDNRTVPGFPISDKPDVFFLPFFPLATPVRLGVHKVRVEVYDAGTGAVLDTGFTFFKVFPTDGSDLVLRKPDGTPISAYTFIIDLDDTRFFAGFNPRTTATDPVQVVYRPIDKIRKPTAGRLRLEAYLPTDKQFYYVLGDPINKNALTLTLHTEAYVKLEIDIGQVASFALSATSFLDQAIGRFLQVIGIQNRPTLATWLITQLAKGIGPQGVQVVSWEQRGNLLVIYLRATPTAPGAFAAILPALLGFTVIFLLVAAGVALWNLSEAAREEAKNAAITAQERLAAELREAISAIANSNMSPDEKALAIERITAAYRDMSANIRQSVSELPPSPTQQLLGIVNILPVVLILVLMVSLIKAVPQS